MNTGEIKPAAFDPLLLTVPDEREVMELASIGLMPSEIAAVMKWPRKRRAAFCFWAEVPGSEIAALIATGRANGRAKPQKELQKAALGGNVEAIKELHQLQARNRFNELVHHMDEDEFTD